MLVRKYRKKIFRPECNPNFQSVHCTATLEQDVSKALPYVNAVLGGTHFVEDPPSVTLELHGKLITIHGTEIWINALKDESEADAILKWLTDEINDAWDGRDKIVPSYRSRSQPRMMEILRLLPRTNCGECGQPTCTVFALKVVEGVLAPDDCPPMDLEAHRSLSRYLADFQFDL